MSQRSVVRAITALYLVAAVAFTYAAQPLVGRQPGDAAPWLAVRATGNDVPLAAGATMWERSRSGFARDDSTAAGSGGPLMGATAGSVRAVSPGAVLVGAGDIARCDNNNDAATAKLLDRIPGTVFIAGDASYPDGSAASFAQCYDPTWGRHKDRTRPSPGNHEYRTPGAKGYFDYFGAAAGEWGAGYYSYAVGDWHVVALNSNCDEIGGCHAGSPQESWLRLDLAANQRRCTVAYWHHPLFTSAAHHQPATETRPLFQALYDYGAEIVMAGHNHTYERFAPQNPGGQLDIARGVRAFVVGTGGASLYRFDEAKPNSEVRNSSTYGVLKLTLHSDWYEWQFVPVAGKTFTDSGSDICH
jgi:hypothetical protein